MEGQAHAGEQGQNRRRVVGLGRGAEGKTMGHGAVMDLDNGVEADLGSGAMVDQGHEAEAGLDCGAEVGLDHGAMADSEALEDLGQGKVADSETMQGLGRAAVANSESLEDLGCGSDSGGGTVEQETTRSDPEEHGAMAEQEANTEQRTTRSAVQTGAKIPIVEQMTTTAKQVSTKVDQVWLEQRAQRG